MRRVSARTLPEHRVHFRSERKFIVVDFNAPRQPKLGRVYSIKC